MTTDFRALCAELIASWDADGCDWKPQHQARWEATVARARAALADGPAVPEGREPASVVEEPSDRDLRQLYADTFDLRSDPASLGPAIVKFARAVLARWGTPALPPPTDKEPTRLRNCPTHGQQPPWAWGCPDCVRQLREELAALQQRHPEPVPEGVTDEELTQLLFEGFRGPIEFLCEAEEEEHLMIRNHVMYARAVLARWGNPAPAPPADGEVAELVSAVHAAYAAYGWVEEKQFIRFFDEVSRLASVIEEGCDCSVDGPINARARAALADGPAVPDGREPASVTGQPNDEELLETLDKATATFPPRHPEAEGLNVVEYALALELRKARAVLARWGTSNLAETRSSLGGMPTPAPADKGEVEELVEFLRIYGDEVMDEYGDVGEHDQLTRAADLLEQRYPAPVPVSERLPGDALCWWYEPDEDDNGSGYGGRWTLLRIRGGTVAYTHCLPAHALPIPQQQEDHQ